MVQNLPKPVSLDISANGSLANCLSQLVIACIETLECVIHLLINSKVTLFNVISVKGSGFIYFVVRSMHVSK